MKTPFNRPYMSGKELYYIADAHFHGKLAGDGPYTKKCHAWIEEIAKVEKSLLTHSCTAALEMAAILMNLEPGDEVIMPSYTFVSTANAFVLRGAVPVFVDIREDTMNIDEELIESAITPKTRALVVVHYAGVACEMDTILDIAAKHDLRVIEDAAQGVMAKYRGRALGGIGDLGAYSFHETKNVISGEGGALLINDSSLIERAEVIREKGTDRSQFFRGMVDKYTWQDIGSSFLPGELIAAFLWAQFEEAEAITASRMTAWNYYHDSFIALEADGKVRRPVIPAECEHNAHMYYLVLDSKYERDEVIQILAKNGVHSVFHYIPLHSSPAGKKFGRADGELSVTNEISERLLRLPLWVGIGQDEQDMAIKAINSL